MDDNRQFTEEERAEAFRLEHAQHLQRQTKALESLRLYVGWLLAITVAGIVMGFVLVVGGLSSSSGF